MALQLDLSSLTWQLGSVPRQPFSAAPRDDRAAIHKRRPARVPGDVRADLVAAGEIPALTTPAGIAGGAWVDDADWWCETTLPGGWDAGETLVLEADGIDYYSAIWLDEHLLATHAGMFSRQVVILSPWLNRPGAHRLSIRVWGGGALPRAPAGPLRRALRALVGHLSPGTEYFPDRMMAPRAQFSYGWDFAPRVLTCGIWDEIRLLACRGAHLEDVWVNARPLAPGADDGASCWTVRLCLRRFSEAALRCRLVVERADGAGAAHAPVEFAVNGDIASAEFTLDDTAQWWPWDQGEQTLYRMHIALLDERGLADERTVVTGVRSVARQRLSDGKPWRFTVNGRPVFLRGANWTPADVLPGTVTRETYDGLIDLAKRAGVNFLRVWGGGVREKRGFWEACDREGLLAWQEFPLACAFLDHYPRDASYLAVLEQEARGAVRLLRNHPSLLAWCGGNEINPQREAAPLRVLAGVVRAQDPSRPWIPASPMLAEGEEHDWDVWHGRVPWTRHGDTTYAFLSEFGVQALPDVATVAEMFDGAPPPLANAAWEARKAQVSKLRHYAGLAVDESVNAAIEQSQRVQAAALQAGIEACRVRREPVGPAAGEGARHPPCGGVAFWQFNEPWHAVSWSVVDRAGRTKRAYEMLRRANQPVLVAARLSRRPRVEGGVLAAGDLLAADIYVVNDLPRPLGLCDATAWIDDLVVWSAGAVQVGAGRAVFVGRLEQRLTGSPCFLTLTLSSAGQILARNEYDLQTPVTGTPGWQEHLRRWLADRLLS